MKNLTYVFGIHGLKESKEVTIRVTNDKAESPKASGLISTAAKKVWGRKVRWHPDVEVPGYGQVVEGVSTKTPRISVDVYEQ
jgi:hypothetical protein